jgi:hypothetical protein
MNLWRWLRQSDRIDALTEAIEIQVRESQERDREREQLESDLSRERAGRISAETLSVERRAEVERLIDELKGVRSELNGIVTERLKSLDSLNVKLMAERAEEKPPDMAQYKKSLEDMGINAVRQMRKIHHGMDAAILTKMHPRFAKAAGAPMNESMAEHAAAD